MAGSELRIVTLKPQANSELVEMLEGALEEARTGSLRGVAMVKVCADRVDTGWINDDGGRPSLMIGGAAVLLSRLSGSNHS